MPLSPLSFLERSAAVWADRLAVRDGTRMWTYAEHADRVGRAARALTGRLRVVVGERVAVVLPNVAAMLELHYAVPATGAVLVPLNTRLAAAEYASILEHSGTSAVVAAVELRERLEPVLATHALAHVRVVWVDCREPDACEYEAMLAEAAPAALRRPDAERSLLSINYTSGTTGRPKA